MPVFSESKACFVGVYKRLNAYLVGRQGTRTFRQQAHHRCPPACKGNQAGLYLSWNILVSKNITVRCTLIWIDI
jgi:hypothetical protein